MKTMQFDILNVDKNALNGIKVRFAIMVYLYTANCSLLMWRKAKPAERLQSICAQCSSNQVTIQLLYVSVPDRLTSLVTRSTVGYKNVVFT